MPCTVGSTRGRDRCPTPPAVLINQIQSGQILRYIVNVPNLSGGILPLATQIVAGLEILLYARR